MTKEQLESIKQGASRWHSTSSDMTLVLVAEIERLQKELEMERQLHEVARAFHNVAVQQRNVAWAELATIKQHGAVRASIEEK
jgi:uncharacterized protein YbaP (TraB family)